MNDPNGLVRTADGTWHVFFQHNPYGDRWGSMSWGHAVSPDLATWTELPVAMTATADQAFFSGSVVADGPALVAAYTSVDAAGRQTQAFARSTDAGRSWAPLPGRLTDPDPDFRDPKLVRTATGWLLLVALSTQRKVRFYRSADLADWTAVGEFGPAGATAGVWEMPDLLRVGDRDVLVVGVIAGGPGGGSGTQFFVGDFDGRTFAATDHGWLDHGPDFYAATSFSGLARRTVLVGWLNDWRYAEAVPTAPWRGVLSVPRELTLSAAGALVQRPVPEPAWTPVATVERPVGVLPVGGDRLRIDAELTGPGSIVVRGSADGREGTRVRWADGRLGLDRRASGRVDPHPDFAAAYEAPLAAPGPLTVLVDRCSVEVFAAGVALSAQVFPAPTSTHVSVSGQVAHITISRPAATSGPPGRIGPLSGTRG
jgi:sucrose-6-phosphate hydrolase SacC (GH32 family)